VSAEPDGERKPLVLFPEPLSSYVILGLVGFVVLVGGVVTIVHPATLDFADYIRDVTIVTAALALAAGGVRVR
jgi:hypothetical protein